MTSDNDYTETPQSTSPVVPAQPTPVSPATPFPPTYSPAPPTKPRANGMATASLIFGIIGVPLGFCFLGIPCVLALIFGIVGIVQTTRRGQRGRGIAIAGTILGGLMTVASLSLL